MLLEPFEGLHIDAVYMCPGATLAEVVSCLSAAWCLTLYPNYLDLLTKQSKHGKTTRHFNGTFAVRENTSYYLQYVTSKVLRWQMAISLLNRI